jgi:hypothetical protein
MLAESFTFTSVNSLGEKVALPHYHMVACRVIVQNHQFLVNVIKKVRDMVSFDAALPREMVYQNAFQIDV